MNKTYYKENVAPLLKQWQQGYISMPKAYIEYHEHIAKTALMHLEEAEGYTLHTHKMVRAGNFDGMMLLEAVVEAPSGKLTKLVWHDSHGTGGFMERIPGVGGSYYFHTEREQKENPCIF